MKKFREAVADLDRAAELHPENARVYHLRGIAYTKLGEREKGLRDLDKAISLNPEYGAAFLSRANVHSELGHTEESDEDMEMAVLLEEKNLQTFADENNIWRSRHLRLEAEGIVAEIDR
jgi:tetratricopeptide (TPR) repeat protein